MKYHDDGGGDTDIFKLPSNCDIFSTGILKRPCNNVGSKTFRK